MVTISTLSWSTRGRRSGALYPHLELTGEIMEIQEGGAVGHFFLSDIKFR